MAADGRRHVLAAGGGMVIPDERVPLLIDYALDLTGRPEPRMCTLNTAMGDDAQFTLRMYSRFAGTRVRMSHLSLFPMPNVADPGDFLLSQDMIFVGGGSVANMMAVWRVHGIDRIMRKAWQEGTVLAGSSAGGICWFEGGTTDSFGKDLRPFTDGLGLLRGSYCPHYDSESRRRPLFRRLVSEGALPGGLACGDGVAAHFADDGLAEVIADRPGDCCYRVEQDGPGEVTETRIGVRYLGA